VNEILFCAVKRAAVLEISKASIEPRIDREFTDHRLFTCDGCLD